MPPYGLCGKEGDLSYYDRGSPSPIGKERRMVHERRGLDRMMCADD